MFVIRFKVQCRPDKTQELRAAFEQVVAPSRAVSGVINFDIAGDLTDPDAFIATEVFEDPAARERQESLPEVAKVMAILPEALAAPPEATVYHVSSTESAM
jgi:quinol monooxygenase YgiN